MLAQPFYAQSPAFLKPGFVITQKFCYLLGISFRHGKVTFSSLHSQPNSSFSSKN